MMRQPQHAPRGIRDSAMTHLHERYGDSVSEQHLRCCGGHRCKVKGAQLPLQWEVHRHVTHCRQAAAFHRGHRHQARAFCLHESVAMIVNRASLPSCSM